MRFAKAFFSGLKGRGALRGAVRRAIGAQNATGREHGFHAGKAGVDRSLARGKTGGIKWSPRASVGQMLGGGALHHTHPKGHGRLSPQDLRSVVTAPNSKGGRNTLWAHSSDGHEAARLTRTAAGQHPKVRAKAFNAAYRATKAPGMSPYNHGRALRSELKRRGLIHSASTVRKLNAAIVKARGMLMTKLIETDEKVEKAGMIPRGGSMKLRRRLWDKREKLESGRRAGGGAEGKRIGRATAYLSQRFRGGGFIDRGHRPVGRRGVYKSLTALDTAISKARGLIPKGGSSKLSRRMGKRHKSGEPGLRPAIAQTYLLGRRTGAFSLRQNHTDGAPRRMRVGRYK